VTRRAFLRFLGMAPLGAASAMVAAGAPAVFGMDACGLDGLVTIRRCFRVMADDIACVPLVIYRAKGAAGR
jgi:hypothetical protein